MEHQAFSKAAFAVSGAVQGAYSAIVLTDRMTTEACTDMTHLVWHVWGCFD